MGNISWHQKMRGELCYGNDEAESEAIPPFHIYILEYWINNHDCALLTRCAALPSSTTRYMHKMLIFIFHFPLSRRSFAEAELFMGFIKSTTELKSFHWNSTERIGIAKLNRISSSVANVVKTKACNRETRGKRIPSEKNVPSESIWLRGGNYIGK